MLYSCLKRVFYCFILLAFFGGGMGTEAFGQTKNYFTGSKSGNRDGQSTLLGFHSEAAIGPNGIFNLASPSNTNYNYVGGSALNDSNIQHATLEAGVNEIMVLGLPIGLNHGAWVTFNNTGNNYLPAGTTTYVALEGMPSTSGLNLLGGDLEIQASGINTSGNLTINSSSEILMDPAGRYFIAVRPESTYNAVRAGLKFKSNVVSLSLASANMGINHMFYYSWPSNMVDCGRPVFTSLFVKDALLGLDLSNLLGSPDSTHPPYFAIDSDPQTYSLITSSILAVGSDASQVIHFGYPGNSTDLVKIRFALPSSLLSLSLLDNITLQAYNGSTAVGSNFRLSSLIGVDLLGLSNYSAFEVYVRPMASYDRIEIRVASFLHLSLGDGVRIHDVSRVVAPPIISAHPSADSICEGSTMSLQVATSTGDNLSYRWYKNQPPDTSWTHAPADTTNPLLIPSVPPGLDGSFYRVSVQGGTCPTNLATVVSDSVRINVKEKPENPEDIILN